MLLTKHETNKLMYLCAVNLKKKKSGEELLDQTGVDDNDRLMRVIPFSHLTVLKKPPRGSRDDPPPLLMCPSPFSVSEGADL